MRDDTRSFLSRMGQPSFDYREHSSLIDDVSPSPWPLLLAVERAILEKQGGPAAPQQSNVLFGEELQAHPSRASQELAMASLIRRISGGAQ